MCECCQDHIDDVVLLKAFHGHLGPWVFAGMRMGRYALGKLNANPHFGIEANAWCPAATPVSCLLDGIQFATGCTLGKQNIHHHISKRVRAIFTNRDTGQSIALRLRPQAMDRAVEEMAAKNDEAGAALIEGMTDEELLEEIPTQ